MSIRIIPAFQQFFDGAGEPLSNGWLSFYLSGSVSTEKATYADISESVANTNPLQLDAEGRCANVFGTGAYKARLYENDPSTSLPGTLVAEFDPVPGGTESAGEFSEWIRLTEYNALDIVTGSDGNFYQSQVNSNQGADPTDSGNRPTPWLRVLRNTSEVVKDEGSVSGTVTLDISEANVFLLQPSADMTIAFANWFNDDRYEDAMLWITNAGAVNITFPTINWVLTDGSFTTTFADMLLDMATSLQSTGLDFIFVWKVDNTPTLYGKLVR